VSTAAILLENATREYQVPPTTALDAVNLTIHSGEFTAIVGPSGSGKSTLLNLIGTLDLPTSGSARIHGIDTRELSDIHLSALRAHHIGFVFQQFHLNEGSTAVENVADGLLYAGVPRPERRRRAREVLHEVGLGHRLEHKPNHMSGGERQRVAIARAIVGRPGILLADEPTGNLDSVSGNGVIELLHALNGRGTTIVVITHDKELAARLPRQVWIRDGRIISDSRRSE
jgi:putative ABC transport system ATP-binding protein